MRLGVDLVFGLSEPPNDPKDQVLKLVQDLEDLYERARDQMSLRAERAANRLSEKAVRKFYRVGDMVRVQVNSLALKPPTKLAPRWSLPFEVKGVRGKTVLVENPRNGVRHLVSHDFLKHCYSAQAVTKGSQSQSCADRPSAQQHAGEECASGADTPLAQGDDSMLKGDALSAHESLTSKCGRQALSAHRPPC